MKWSLEHYNFICYNSANESIFEAPAGRHYFPAERLFEYTDRDVAALYTKTESLAMLPVAVVAEVDFRRQFTMTPALLTSGVAPVKWTPSQLTKRGGHHDAEQA